ncbi:MAG: EF-P lysine aminoacylase GenX, partial [Pirellulales bacterium]
VTHSFRAGERGKLHNPEFAIVEWYRVGDDMEAGIALVDELMQTLLGKPPAQRTTYKEAFQRHAGVHPFAVSDMDLAAVTRTLIGEEISIDPKSKTPSFVRDELLNLILAKCVEPQLGRDRPEIIFHYPASQAALAKTIRSAEGHEVAERFELYYRGIELANGYHELADAAEQRRRFEQVNAERVADGRPALPIPESLLQVLERGFPDCTGVALGFDRLAMLAANANSIDEVLAFPAE